MTTQAPRDLLPWIYWGVFFLIVPLLALWVAIRPSPVLSTFVPVGPVLSRDLPAYHVITAADIMTGTLQPADVLTNTVRSAPELVGAFTITALGQGKPVTANQVARTSDAGLLSDTFVVGIPAGGATTLGGKLNPGDVVSMAVVPISNTTAPAQTLFDRLLVLDVNTTEKTGVVILAIPAARWQEYLDKSRDAHVILARRAE